MTQPMSDEITYLTHLTASASPIPCACPACGRWRDRPLQWFKREESPPGTLRATLDGVVPDSVWSGLEAMRKIGSNPQHTHNERCFAQRYIEDMEAVLTVLVASSSGEASHG